MKITSPPSKKPLFSKSRKPPNAIIPPSDLDLEKEKGRTTAVDKVAINSPKLQAKPPKIDYASGKAHTDLLPHPPQSPQIEKSQPNPKTTKISPIDNTDPTIDYVETTNISLLHDVAHENPAALPSVFVTGDELDDLLIVDSISHDSRSIIPKPISDSESITYCRICLPNNVCFYHQFTKFDNS